MKKFLTALRGKLPVVAGVGTAAAVAAPAFAQSAGGVDVTSVVSAINGAAAPIAEIGAAVLIVMVGIKVYKWVRRAM